jgi:hypothetical protein
MRRRLAYCLFACSALIAAGCSDTTAPTAVESSLSTLNSVSEFSAVKGKKSQDKTSTFVFDLLPGGGHVSIGGFALDYPAGAVCDPKRSSYGPTEWKKACVVLTTSITVSAKYTIKDGKTSVDLSPNMRFSPDKVVMLSLQLRELRGQYLTDALKEQFALRSSGVEDDVLATFFQVKGGGKATGWVSRQVFHFSGYYVRSGEPCEDFSDPECRESDGP